MPKEPRGERRPTDVLGTAVREGHADREDTEELELELEPTNPAAVLGKPGGVARARKLTAERGAEIAKEAAAKRWERRD